MLIALAGLAAGLNSLVVPLDSSSELSMAASIFRSFDLGVSCGELEWERLARTAGEGDRDGAIVMRY